MLLNTLESLVLRTVTVERASLTVELPRHGPGYQADSQTPEILISRRHPSQGAEPTRMRPNDAIADDGVVKAVSGAGRSFCLASVPSRRSAVPATARANGCQPATRSVSFTTGNRNLPAAGTVKEKHPTVGVAWCKPATRTPPASTRGKGA